MVYTGPSDGCHLCRKRRIKCDGGRPGCRRCAVYKTECPGYRPETFVRVAKPNASSQSKNAPKLSLTAQAASPESSGGSSTSSSSPPGSFSSSSPPQDSLMSLTRSPTPSWEEWSIATFMHDWTMPATSTSMNIGFLEFLPDMAAATQANSDLSLALNAAACASLASQTGAPEMMKKARTTYGKALTALNASLKDPVESIKDSTLAVVILLQIFEHITCDDTWSIGNHDEGLRMLLQLRGDEKLDTPQGRGVARIIFGYLFGRDVNQRKETSDFMIRECLRLGYPPEHPSQQYAAPGQRITDHLSRLAELLKPSPGRDFTTEQVIQVMRSTIPFQQQFETWAASLPSEWHHQRIQLPAPALPTQSISSIPHTRDLDFYSSTLHAAAWNLYRMQHIVLHSQLLRLSAQYGIPDWSLSPNPDFPAGCHQSSPHSLRLIREISDLTLSSTPPLVGEIILDHRTGRPTHVSSPVRGRAVGAYYLLAPLMRIMDEQGFSTDEQKQDAENALAYVGHVLGIKRGLRAGTGATKQMGTPDASARVRNLPAITDGMCDRRSAVR